MIHGFAPVNKSLKMKSMVLIGCPSLANIAVVQNMPGDLEKLTVKSQKITEKAVEPVHSDNKEAGLIDTDEMG